MAAKTLTLTELARQLPGRQDFPFTWITDSEWQPVRTYPDTAGEGANREVKVSVMRMPARFWRIECPALDLDLSTGSGGGIAELVDAIATAIASGMLGRCQP